MSVSGSSFTARDYQVELLEAALKGNTIVCLGTGTGKTFIAVLLIKEYAHTVLNPLSEGGQRIVFIVPSVALVEQQANYVKRHTSLKVGQYVGSMGVDFWDKKVWDTEFQLNEVLVMTAQILVNILQSGFIRLKQISLLVFDECHRAVKNHPFSQIMGSFTHCPEVEHPRILGLTAAVLSGKCKPHRLEENIRTLEITLRSRCTTTRDLTSVREHGTQPEEELLQYVIEENILDAAVRTLSGCEDQLREARLGGIMGMIQKTLKKLMSNCCDVLIQLGPWALQCYAHFVFAYLERLKSENLIDSDDLALAVLAFCEDDLSISLEQCRGITAPSRCIYQGGMFVSHKAKTLLTYLKKFACIITANTASFCAIVFVERRSTAKALCELIMHAIECDSDLKFLKPLWTVGAGGMALVKEGSSEAGASHSRQNAVLRKFRSGECNLLVSTNATEEGLDIPSCNLVIQFDPPKEVRAYIQAKGRARKRGSRYIVMVEQSGVQLMDDELEDYSTIEQLLGYMCIDRAIPTEIEVEDRQIDLPEYHTGKGAWVSMASSIDLVNRYCDKLPGDHFTHLAPQCDIYMEDGGYMAELALPRNSPCKEALKSDVWPSKVRAKQHVALLMCEHLHKMRQLDDHLCPVLEDESDAEEEESGSEDSSLPSSGDSRKAYEMKIPEVLKDCRPSTEGRLHLYRINIEPVEQTELSFGTGSSCLGILTAKPLPSLPVFSLYPKSCEVHVSLELHPVGYVSKAILQQIDRWHEHCFKRIIGVGNNPSLCFDDSDQHRGYRIVPLTNSKTTCWTLDMQLLSSGGVLSQGLRATGELVGCIVTRNYLENSKQQFRVVAVRHDLKPSSEFPDSNKALTYSEYYEKRYRVKIKDLEQPLLEVEPLSRKANALVRVVKRSRAAKRIHLIAELCNVDPLPADIWDAGLLLGSVLWRLEQLLVAEELRIAIGTHVLPTLEYPQCFPEQTLYKSSEVCEMSSPRSKRKLVGRTPESVMAVSENLVGGTTDVWVRIDSADSGSASSLGDCLEEGELQEGQEREGDSMRLLWNIVAALTAKSSADSFNLERLETLGDSFLKQAISMSLFWEHSTKHEGQLSKKRSRIVCNANLFSLAGKKNLPAYMFVTAFQPSVMWLPPGFIHSPSVETEDTKEKSFGYRTQLMSNKCAADCVEALIGAYLVYGGYSAALHVMKWLGIPVAPAVVVALCDPSLEHVTSCISQISSVSFYEGRDLRNQRSPETLCAKFADLEKSIGYEFKDKRWLLQALTHPSFHWNRVTDSYQRLEFLGDALIDYLVTRKIFEDHPHLNPGQLTDVRAALVCNDTFAEIAVKQGYHQHLKALSPRLFRAIDLYAESQSQGVEPDASLMEIADESDDDEEIEVPKVLGDIFESVAGAIFLDSGLHIEELWRHYLGMLLPYIEKYGKDPPIQPVRQLCEMMPSGLEFSAAKKERDGALSCTVTLPSGDHFTGTARNGKLARVAAAKKAIRHLNKTDP